MDGKTAVIMSHRVSSVKNASHIIVLDAGKVAEEGTHDELLRQNGLYAEMYQQQLAEEQKV